MHRGITDNRNAELPTKSIVWLQYLQDFMRSKLKHLDKQKERGGLFLPRLFAALRQSRVERNDFL